MIVEVFVVEHPTKKKAEEGGKLKEIIFGPQYFGCAPEGWDG